jgi:group II intron reverse transcriptase/maturase
MQSTQVYLEILQERGKRGLPLERVYRQLFNRNLYLTAYGKIYKNAGALTKGVTDETADGMSLKKIDDIINVIRHERYIWKPTRRTYIAKKNGKKRPLGIPVWSDKIVQEVIRMILTAYYDPQFSSHSHGFRSKHSCATALQEIYYNWAGTSWFIEGDISHCFDKLDHELLIATLQEKIHDGRFINLIRDVLNAGYLEDWQFNKTLSGCPQGGLVSPVLANILLDKLDKFVETTLIPKYTRGEKRKRNEKYSKIMASARYQRKKGNGETAKALRKQGQRMPSVDPNDSDYRRLKYVRFADDWLIGFTGPKEEAEEIKQQIEVFLRDELKLELSTTKTLITHARSEEARFLGYAITTLQSDGKQSQTSGNQRHKMRRRSINGRIGLQVPKDVIKEKRQRYRRGKKAIHRAELLSESDFSIVRRYQSEYRGLVNYYRLAYNMHTLNELR